MKIKIATYLRTTNNHVRYRVTPIFRENELLPRAITLEHRALKTMKFLSM
jgi:DNA-entry nuclease